MQKPRRRDVEKSKVRVSRGDILDSVDPVIRAEGEGGGGRQSWYPAPKIYQTSDGK